MSIYVVTGRHRTGTSMMMHALSVGGLTAVYDLQVEQRIRSRVVSPDYDPNPLGFYAAPDNVLPHDITDGSLIKCPIASWTIVAAGDYIVVHMTRDNTERQRSMERAFGVAETGLAYQIGEDALKARTDCITLQVVYADVVNNPIGVFTMLAASLPIDPIIAASTVDPGLWRN